MNMILRAASREHANVLIARNAAKILDQSIEIADERCAVFCAEDNVEQVQSVGVGDVSNVRGLCACVRARHHRRACRR
jgi:hypothetical protein